MRNNNTASHRIMASMMLSLVATLSLVAQNSITLKLTGEPLPKALQLIEQQGGKSIIFSISETEEYTVDATIEDVTQAEAIDRVLRGKPFVAKERDDYFVIRKQENKELAPELHPVEVARRERIAEVMPAINVVSVSTNKKSMALGGLSTIVREKAFGLQIGGLYNHVGGMGRGVAIAGLGNTTLGTYYGMQTGGLWNYNADSAKGLMIGGLSNIVGGEFDGLQIAGLINLAKDAYGLQLAGLVNASHDAFGLQCAGLTNIAKDVYGLQFAGLFNVAERVKGVQFASILNVAEESDFPIALINIVKNGDKGLALSYDIMGNAMVSFRSGGTYSYGIIGVGYSQQAAGKVVAEGGYGIHVPVCKWLQVNNEVKATAPINTSSANFGYLLAPSITLWEHYNLFGGASINYLMSDAKLDFVPKHELWGKQAGNGMQRLYIGYQVGVQYVF